MEDKYKFINGMLIIVLTAALMWAMYMLGYNHRGEDINYRLHMSENNDEGCFSREEVGYFIFGEDK